MERHYTPHAIQELKPGEHVLWLTDAQSDQDPIVRSLISGPLRNGEAVLYLYHLYDPRRALIALAPEFETACARGSLELESAVQLFLKDGVFRAERAVEELGKRVERSRERGFSSLRVIVEMTWVFEVALGAERLSELVARIDVILSTQPLAVVAKYDRQFFKPALLLELLSSYRQVLVAEQLYENFYFVPANHALVQQHQAAVLHQSIETLRALGEAEQALEHRSAQLKQAEGALETLHSIIDSMGDAVFAVDEKGDCVFCNKSFENILGYGLLTLPINERVRKIGNYLPDMVTPYPVGDLPVARAMRGEATDNVEIFIRNDRRPNGVWLSANGRPLRDRHGNLKGGLVVSRDVTRQKRAKEEQERLEEQMFRTQKLESLGVLAGGIAHDFNNLLMGVLGNADLALREVTASPALHGRVSQITVAARRLADLTNQLLAYSGQGPLSEERLDLSDLVREMSELLRPAISKRAAVEFQFLANLPPILADATQIRQIAMNLITNASDAIGENAGAITIRTGTVTASEEDLQHTYLADNLKPGRYVFLEISDTGCGMDEQTLAKIFDPFFSTKFTGRGLGLAAVLGIVRRHQGALQVESRVGHGTRFRVLFPAVEGADETATAPAVHSEDWNGTGKVLVVDDEQAVREIAGEMLKHLGFEALTAGTGKQALKIFHQHAPDLRAVILDLTMPDMDGELVLSRMRQLSQNARFILSSGYHESDIVSRLGKKVVRGYLQKPYGQEQLSKVLQDALR